MTRKKVPLSVIILAHRRDERLAEAVSSAQFAAEVLVVVFDGLEKWPSTLPNATLIKESGELSDFSLARNQALKHAKHEWVLFLDSDEQIAPRSVGDISSIVEVSDSAGAYVVRQDIYFGRQLKHGEVGRVRLLRLAKKGQLQFQRPVHEVARVEGRVVTTDIVLYHSSHASTADFLDSVRHYAKLEARYRWSEGKRFSWWELVCFPLGKWLQNAVLRSGWLDGWQGMTYVTMMSIHSLLVRVYLYELEYHTA